MSSFVAETLQKALLNNGDSGFSLEPLYWDAKQYEIES